MRVFDVLENYLEALLELIYPSDLHCIVCNKYLLTAEKYSICNTCFEKISFDKGIFRGPVAVGVHENPLKKLVYRLKYQDATYLSSVMGRMMVEVYKKEELKVDMLVAVPLHRKKQKQRGYNQACLLAKYMGKKLGIPYIEQNLIRVKDTDVMYNQTREERWKNVEDAFSVKNPQVIDKKKILLVDDIFTTGATVEACSKVLMRAGAKSVEVMTFTRGVNSE
jgi:ComF family protein